MSLNVYQLEFRSDTNHNQNSIFIETNNPKPGSGIRYDVQGSIVLGMTYYHQTIEPPENDPEFLEKILIGHVKPENLRKVDLVCQSIPVPRAQLRPDGTKIYPDLPLRRGRTWTIEVKRELFEEGIIVECFGQSCRH